MELCTAVSNSEQVLSLYIAPVHLANVFFMEEYLATNSDGYLCKNSLRALIAASLGASQRS